MILLLGGTSETRPVAEALAKRGHRVLVSTATDVPLAIGDHPHIEHRHGRLDREQLAELVAEKQVRAIVDVTHPYATAIRTNAQQVADRKGIPRFSFVRPTAPTPATANPVHHAADHASAARLAVSFGKPILLTIGSRNVRPYVEAAREAGLELSARVLPHEESLAACRKVGLAPNAVIAQRGPFSVQQNRRVLRQLNRPVLVTKDSGDTGGVPAKLTAADAEHCPVVIVDRPGQCLSGPSRNLQSFVQMVLGKLQSQ